jgi:hypothetical protein
MTFRNVLVLAALVAPVFLPTALRAAPSTAGCDGFTGRWITTWQGGTATLRVAGTKGTYDFKGGTVTGRLADGNVFTGSYAENDGTSGTFRFTLLPDGNSFKGWYAQSTDPDRQYYWRGICIGS